MKEIYILVKPEEVERISEEVKRYRDIANIKVITNINEIFQDKRRNLEIANIIDGTKKSLNDEVMDTMSDELFRDIAERFYNSHKVPDVEEFLKENTTEFHKLSSFDRKEKNKARKKLEHQALEYQNRHYKK